MKVPPVAVCKRLQDPAGDDHAVHLVRAVVDPARAGGRQHVRRAASRRSGRGRRAPGPHGRSRPGDACAAKNLIAEISTRASSPPSILCAASSVISRQAWICGVAVGDPVLHRLLLGQRPAERLALERVRAHQRRTRAASGRASASRGGCGPARAASARSGTRSRRSPSVFAERHADARVAHLAVRRPAAGPRGRARGSAGRRRRPACRPGR